VPRRVTKAPVIDDGLFAPAEPEPRDKFVLPEMAANVFAYNAAISSKPDPIINIDNGRNFRDDSRRAYYKKALIAADEADAFMAKGNILVGRARYQLAVQHIKEACESILKETDNTEPFRSTLFELACQLAVSADDRQAAVKFAQEGLNGQPPIVVGAYFERIIDPEKCARETAENMEAWK